MQNPNGIIPKGYKNGGMTYMQAFEQTHGFLPNGLDRRAAATSAGAGGEQPESGSDAAADAEADAGQMAPEEGEGDDTYHNFGDRGPQPDDFKPAQ